MKENQL